MGVILSMQVSKQLRYVVYIQYNSSKSISTKKYEEEEGGASQPCFDFELAVVTVRTTCKKVRRKNST